MGGTPFTADMRVITQMATSSDALDTSSLIWIGRGAEVSSAILLYNRTRRLTVELLNGLINTPAELSGLINTLVKLNGLINTLSKLNGLIGALGKVNGLMYTSLNCGRLPSC